MEAPQNAWILTADDKSYPNRQKLKQAGLMTRQFIWTCAPQVEHGDSLFLYWIAPRKAVCCIGRATDEPFWSGNIGVNSARATTTKNWWVEIGSLVEIEPVAYHELEAILGFKVLLKGRTGHYIPPDAANRLLAHAKVKYAAANWCADQALTPVVRRQELPDPSTASLKDIATIPSGLLRVEREVETYVVEPLLRLACMNRNLYCFVKQYPTSRGLADYAILHGNEVVAIIEAKLRLRLGKSREWHDSPELAQARKYADEHSCPFLLIDCESMYAFEAKASAPAISIKRRDLRVTDLRSIRTLLTSQ